MAVTSKAKCISRYNGIFKMKGLIVIVFERERGRENHVVVEGAAYLFLCIFSRMSILFYILLSLFLLHGKLFMLVL